MELNSKFKSYCDTLTSQSNLSENRLTAFKGVIALIEYDPALQENGYPTLLAKAANEATFAVAAADGSVKGNDFADAMYVISQNSHLNIVAENVHKQIHSMVSRNLIRLEK